MRTHTHTHAHAHAHTDTHARTHTHTHTHTHARVRARRKYDKKAAQLLVVSTLRVGLAGYAKSNTRIKNGWRGDLDIYVKCVIWEIWGRRGPGGAGGAGVPPWAGPPLRWIAGF